MAEQGSIKRPMVSLLTSEFKEKIIDEAKNALEKTGAWIDNVECLELLADGGAQIDREKKKAFIPRRLVEASIKSVPSSITMYDRNGNPSAFLEGNNTYYSTLLCQLEMLDVDRGVYRKPLTEDVINYVKMIDALENIDFQAPIAGTDTPLEIWGYYKHFLSLRYSNKPAHGGLYAKEDFQLFKDLQVTVRGSEKALREKPLIISVNCPAPPLRYSDLVSYNLMRCAEFGIPQILWPCDIPGIAAPMTLAGAVVQSVAEGFVGIVISQLVKPGAPIISGNTEFVFDMRHNSILGGSVEGMMINIAHIEVMKHLGMVTFTHAPADAKRPDAQAGLESGIGCVLATLAGVNIVGGAGGLNNEEAQSLEQLVIDNEIRGMARRLAKGIIPRGEILAGELLSEGLYDGQHFMLSPNTIRWMREEYYWPGPVIIRENEATWKEKGSPTVEQRVKDEVKRILATHQPEPLDKDIDRELCGMMSKAAAKYGMSRLPITPEIS